MKKRNCLPGALRLHKGGYLNKSNSMIVINNAYRAEVDENPRVYIKAVRATLMALGFDPEWVEGDFRKMIEDYYLEGLTNGSVS